MIDLSQNELRLLFIWVDEDVLKCDKFSNGFSYLPIRTAVNSQSGVRTPMGGVFTGGLVILALCVLTPWFYYIPKAALAAVIISAVIQMVDYKIVATLWRANSMSSMMK